MKRITDACYRAERYIDISMIFLSVKTVTVGNQSVLVVPNLLSEEECAHLIKVK